MVFSSIFFIFFFLPIILTFYHLLGKKYQNSFLLLSSLLFYFWGEQSFLIVVISSTYIDFFCGFLISGAHKEGPLQKLSPEIKKTFSQKFGLCLSIATNIGFLAYFKYFNFGINIFNEFMLSIGAKSLLWGYVGTLGLPLGISFYTFQSMSYTIDVYRGEVKATRNFIDFACYVTLFPQLVAGPIVRYRDIQNQLTNRLVSRRGFAEGVHRFILGLSKKVLLANTFAVTVDGIFALEYSFLSCPLAWLGIVCYALQIYFDFSGYSDMAIGLGLMFGFEFPENFNYPYISKSITEFWRRWHISLSTWFRDYLYIPLGGSRAGLLKTYRNLVLVFLLCGLWHGASWTFIVWGLYYGVFLIVERAGFSKILKRFWFPFQHIYTLLAVLVGWVFFRAETLSYALDYLKTMFYFGKTSPYSFGEFFLLDIKLALGAGLVLSTPVYPTMINMLKNCSRGVDNTLKEKIFLATIQCLGLLLLFSLFFLSTISIASGIYNPFLYFRF